MPHGRTPWIRGVIALGLVGAVTTALLAGPAGALKPSPQLQKLRRNLSIIQGVNSTGGTVADTLAAVADLQLPKGNYAIFASVELLASSVATTVECRLQAGVNQESKSVTVPASGRAEIVLNYAAQFTGAGGLIQVLCADNNAAAVTAWDNASLTLLKMPKITTGVDISV